MMTTMFVSMWMNNTAAAAMMSPITLAVLQELEGVSRELKTFNNSLL